MKTKELTTRQITSIKISQYILEAISTEGYNVATETEAHKLAFLNDTFKAEYCHRSNISYYKGNKQLIFTNWLMGLPSCFNIDFENYRIIELGKEWGILAKNATERQEDAFISKWWGAIYMRVQKMARKHNITIGE